MTMNIMPRASAPLFRDPIHDGAADPMIIQHHQTGNWWLFYTARRANLDSVDVSYCHGTPIGAAESRDHGRNWVFRGYLSLDFEPGINTFWAPEIVYAVDKYHMFVTYIQGAPNHFGVNESRILHYTSDDLLHWNSPRPLLLSSSRVIDPCLLQMKDGRWRMWFKDEKAGPVSMVADSRNLEHWQLHGSPAIADRPHEGVNVFVFRGAYWAITDCWRGLALYRSDDAVNWAFQHTILDQPSNRPDDRPSGAHADVLTVDDRAYIFYFTHPGRTKHIECEAGADGVIPYELRRSSVQVAQLEMCNNTLEVVDRDSPFYFYLP